MIKRTGYINKLLKYKDRDLIKILTGIRRCGKSILLFELYYDKLLSLGVNKNHIIKINLEAASSYSLRKRESFVSYVNSQINDDSKYYLLVDEIQFLEEFEEAVNGIRVDYNIDIYLTGSNSKLLSKDISTVLRGRSIAIEIFPLSFQEIYESLGGDKNSLLNEYFQYGGLPYLQDIDKSEKIDYLRMVDETVVHKDIIERYRINNIQMFGAVYDFLCSNIGAYVSSYKIANSLVSYGFKNVSHETVGNFLEYLCDAYLFYKVNRYDIKGKNYLKTLNKYYCCDIGMRNARINFRQVEVTHTLENIVYLELLRRGYLVDVGKNYQNDIDFIARGVSDTYYIQVAYTINLEEKREQELSSFRSINDGFKKIIITMDSDPFTLLENGYKKLNLLDFLLDNDALKKI